MKLLAIGTTGCLLGVITNLITHGGIENPLWWIVMVPASIVNVIFWETVIKESI